MPSAINADVQPQKLEVFELQSGRKTWSEDEG